MLGSFPPARKRWCMEFFYPNFTNDMWRIFGICFYGDKLRFIDEKHKTFRREAIGEMLDKYGIGIYDTATAVRRMKGTASDKDLEVVETTDLNGLLQRIPHCRTVVATGQKATDISASDFGVLPPGIGTYTEFTLHDKKMRLYRMPSSSRAYPMKVEDKAAYYHNMFAETGLL